MEPHHQERNQHDICRSDAQCLNGGNCIGGDTFGTYTRCDCLEGFGGERCEDHCPLECQNQGVCVANDDTYRCKCFGLYTGTLCTIAYVNCQHGIRCYNGGVCANDDDDVISCHCPVGYVGSTCRHKTIEAPLSNTEQFFSTVFRHENIMPFSALVASFGLFIGVMIFSRLRRPMDHRYTGVELQASSPSSSLRNIV